jgi:hypothetical protein
MTAAKTPIRPLHVDLMNPPHQIERRDYSVGSSKTPDCDDLSARLF